MHGIMRRMSMQGGNLMDRAMRTTMAMGRVAVFFELEGVRLSALAQAVVTP